MRAMSEAMKSECRQRHGAILVSGSSVLATGCNVLKNSPNVFGKFQKNRYTVHAEARVLKQIEIGDRRLKHATLYVARASSLDEPALSRPCDECIQLIRLYGIATVVYTV